jgi:hypothetical protein
MGHRGKDFHLTLPQLKFVSKMPCTYCGKEPSNVFYVRYRTDGKAARVPGLDIRYSGLDRVDSSKGYIHGNVVPCCGECNLLKNDGSLDDFFAHVERIRSHKSSTASVLQLAESLFDSLP